METKRIVIVFLLVSVLLTACGTENKIMCHYCNAECQEGSSYCYSCGSYLMLYTEGVEHEEIPKDYSKFGFQNDFGLTEWISIYSYDFSDAENPYVSIVRPEVLSFENGYLQSRAFDVYSGDFSLGKLSDAMGYDIVSNSVLIMDDHSTYEITHVNSDYNIPIIKTNHTLYRNTGESITDGTFIPTYFIDFSKTEIVRTYGGDVAANYYLNTALIAASEN